MHDFFYSITLEGMSISKITSLSMISRFLKGMVIGVANLVPGISGSTIAYIFHVYFSSLEAFYTLVARKTKKTTALIYLFPIVAGVICSLLLFSKLFHYLFLRHVFPISWLFLGIIIGSIPFTFHQTVHQKCGRRELVVFIFCLTTPLLLFLLPSFSTDTISLIWIALSAFAATIAMAVPGLSGSFILVVLGTYQSFIQALATFHVPTLSIFIIGALSGAFAFIKIFRLLFRLFPTLVSWGIMGFVFASPALVFFHTENSYTLVSRIITLVIGISISIIFTVYYKYYGTTHTEAIK